MSRRSHGYSLVELLVMVAIIGMVLIAVVPAFGNLQRISGLRSASAQLRSLFHQNRSRAIARGTNVGMKFLQLGGRWHVAVYLDGDSDGIRNDDIKTGTDPLLEPPRTVFRESAAIGIGLLKTPVKDPDGDVLKSSVAFGASTICSFSPIGASTPGTIYLTDGRRNLWCVRVYGATAKIRVLRYDAGAKKWVP